MSDIHQMTTPLGEIALSDALSYIDRLRAEVYRVRTERAALERKAKEPKEPKNETTYMFWDSEKDEPTCVTGTYRAIKILEARMVHLDKQASLLREIRQGINDLNP